MSRLGRWTLATLGLLLVQGWALALPLMHAVHEARETRGQQARAMLTAGCPLDCQEPGHEHRGHDPATCASCHASRAIGSVTRIHRLDAGQTLIARHEAPAIRPQLLADDAPPRLRGPPAPSALS